MEFCSIGPKCHSAKILQYIKKKKESYPFDWIYSNLPMVLHCIRDEFRTFMDKTYYMNKDLTLRMQTHTFYFPITLTMFNHHNPLLSEDYYYYNRCISRFITLLKSDTPKLFLYFAEMAPNSWAEIVEFNAQFSRITKFYKIVAILYTLGKEHNAHIEYNKEIILVNITVTSKTDGTRFDLEEDNRYIESILIRISENAFPVNFAIY